MMKLRNLIAAALLTLPVLASLNASAAIDGTRAAAGSIRAQPVTGSLLDLHGRSLVGGTLLTEPQALAVSAIMARNASVLRITI